MSTTRFAVVAGGFFAMAIGPVARGQDREAEKLFRGMEQKILEAKAVQFDVTIETMGGAKDRVGFFKGALLVTKDNKVRLEVSGDDFGEARSWRMVSDGKRVYLRPYSLGVAEVSKEEETLAAPKKLHDHLTMRTMGLGVFLNVLRMPLTVLQADDPDFRFDVWDFKAGAAEKVGGRQAKVVRFRAGRKPDDGVPGAVWIDSETQLPLKRVMDLRGSKGVVGGILITESYKDFTLEPTIREKAFVLPTMKVPLQENVAVEKLPKAVTAAAAKRFPKTRLRGAVLARPGSEWLRPDQTKAAYLLDLENGRLHIALWVLPEGGITEIINEIKSDELPKTVKQYLDKNHAGEAIGEVNEIIKVKEGKEALEFVKVFLSGARVLYFSSEGKFVKEEK